MKKAKVLFYGSFCRLKNSLVKPHQYRWKVGPWQKCSKDCGRGMQVRAVACFDSHRDVRVTQILCRMNVVKPKSERQCNVHKCTEGKWIRGEWSQCSVTCGKGIQTRSVSCVSAESGQLIDTCKGEAPPTERVCPDNPDCRHQVPQSRSHIEHRIDAGRVADNRHAGHRWRTGAWSIVSCSIICSSQQSQYTVYRIISISVPKPVAVA